ncbi:ROK family protein [Paraneptunicella aestuarii]|uniref:ROK family protein n=1 Tax=Paraneptunicella aestuarii TaxID=2831148 RepID=UPI001E290557|nr:ROK family protein [Paraneptunicella aestuarii]UAA39738.1 ROK family protein [Paraneptunicella aestuarii]
MTYIVVDVGGTNLRVGVYDSERPADSALTQVKRVKVQSLEVTNDTGENLYRQFLDQLQECLEPYLRQYPDTPVGISFPGPVTPEGIVTAAPTLWGDELHNIPLLQDCRKLLERDVVVLNDITAAVWRYADIMSEDFCLYTISSGVGNKVFRQGEVLLNERGMGGELGHCQVAFDEYALPCDCGGSGHLGAVASGRGMVQLTRFMASLDPKGFKKCRLHELCLGKPEYINTHKLVAALLQGDEFCTEVMKKSQRYLVTTMSNLYHAIGIKRFVFIGGFSVALGDVYLRSLQSIVAEFQWFGLDKEELPKLCRMGYKDDDHSLIGMGRYLQQYHKSEREFIDRIALGEEERVHE